LARLAFDSAGRLFKTPRLCRFASRPAARSFSARLPLTRLSRRKLRPALWNVYELCTCAALADCAITPQLQATETLTFASHKQERLPTASLQRAQTRTSAAGTRFPAGAICALRYLNCVLPASIENHFVVASRLLPDAEPRLD